MGLQSSFEDFIMTDYLPLLDFARYLAQETTALIMPHFYHCVAEFKPDGSEVTEADRSAERRMRELIHAVYPLHRVLGEEYGSTGPEQGDFQWILDPVDGTHWLTLGVPTFGTLIGLLEKGKPVVGVIAFPAMQEVVFAAAGFGCWYGGEGVEPVRVSVKRVAKLEEAYCSASGAHHSDIRPAAAGLQVNLSAYIRAAGRFRFIGDCLQHALVCRGRIQAALDVVMKPWDIAALVPCVEEAGGMATSLSSHSEDVVCGGSLLSSCGGSLHQEILNKLDS
jgi:histidinol-phosphatase